MATIQGIYVALFGRPADPLGLAYFNEATNNGADLTAIGDLASTAEYQDRFEGMNNAQIVNEIFQSLFGRAPDLAGLEFFVAALNNGTYNINNVAIAILDGAQGDDAAIVANKVAAADAFTAALDTAEEVLAYQGDAAAAAGRAYLAPVTADEASIPDEAAVDAAVQAVVDGYVPGTPGATFTLTTGLDFANSSTAFINGSVASDFRFSSKNETIEALAGTLSAGDVLQDASTSDNDTLNLRTNGASDLTTVAGLGVTVQNIENINITASADDSAAVNLASVFSGGKNLTIAGTLAGVGGIALSNYVAAGFTNFDFSGITTAGAIGGVTLTGGAASTVGITAVGGAGNDVLSGGAGDDVISGGAGDDQINGGAGNNTLNGGAGNDTITATSGNNTVDLGAGAGAQSFTATTGNNTVSATGATGAVTVTLGNGDNTITTDASPDTITVGNGANTISTGAGIDAITAGNGANEISSGAGNDTVIVGNGNNTVDAGAGDDAVWAGSGNNTIVGGAGNDAIRVGVDNLGAGLAAGAGDNTITGGAGADTILITNGTKAGAQMIIVGEGDTGVTTATADSITGFTTNRDKLDLGITDGSGGVGGNYVELDNVAATVEAAVTAATASLTGGVQFVLVHDTVTPGANSYLVFDRDGDGTADGAIVLVGTTATGFDATDIIA